MVNEQGDYEGGAHQDVVENSIGPTNHTESVDPVYNSHYKHPTSPTTHPSTTTEIIQEVHGIEERCKEQTYTMVNMMKMEGKKVFHITNQRVKVKLDGWANANLMPSFVYIRINPQMFDDNGAPLLEKFDKDWANLVAYAETHWGKITCMQME